MLILIKVFSYDETKCSRMTTKSVLAWRVGHKILFSHDECVLAWRSQAIKVFSYDEWDLSEVFSYDDPWG